MSDAETFAMGREARTGGERAWVVAGARPARELPGALLEDVAATGAGGAQRAGGKRRGGDPPPTGHALFPGLRSGFAGSRLSHGSSVSLIFLLS